VKILLIEADKEQSSVMAVMLACQLDVTAVIPAASLEQATGLLAGVDVAIVDVHLDSVGVESVLDWINKAQDLGVPSVICSNVSSPEVIQACGRSDAMFFFPKASSVEKTVELMVTAAIFVCAKMLHERKTHEPYCDAIAGMARKLSGVIERTKPKPIGA